MKMAISCLYHKLLIEFKINQYYKTQNYKYYTTSSISKIFRKNN